MGEPVSGRVERRRSFEAVEDAAIVWWALGQAQGDEGAFFSSVELVFGASHPLCTMAQAVLTQPGGREGRRALSRRACGQVKVRGQPDHGTGLTDRLTRKVFGVTLERSEDQLPSVDLASITTSSLPALKAYLRGERHY
jgi:hypothetical protein